MWRWEHGEKRPTQRHTELLAGLYGLTLADLARALDRTRRAADVAAAAREDRMALERLAALGAPRQGRQAAALA